MKTVRRSILCLTAFFLAAPILRAQDYSQYRDFSLGASLATVLKQTEQKLADANVTHDGPALLQEVTWWPANTTGASHRSDSIEQILFSFHNGLLYKMSVTYDQTSTEGLTADDMMKSISAKYGPTTSVAPVSDPTSKDHYDAKGTLVATWENTQYSFNLVRSSFTDRFGLIIYSKAANAQAELALVEALILEKQNAPKTAAALEKKQSDDLELVRLKNQKVFRP
ncbi:MAG TPA: hypothetical protein VKH15_10875 [Candidatus Acidoferrum sp.]|nr:hypothetical protein [Candidatus Acidoferrum sp.]